MKTIDEQQPKKKKFGIRVCANWQAKVFNAELERKLPNEFKGSIKNFNHRSCGGEGQVDDNQYSYY